ncbi:hypothetical protein QK289_14275 [Exiguobacterium antarcticum]|uniref:Uncharacterized protein n=1 Tax=Exiguobacterium antarcticum TaxID=132920 RepID=A0ABT6R5G8_9BACL|nr:hypothetical protein [Exiguobacterium antarcticum]MDI3236177.1 hypothetical protein [Exiguobacterium antarcticum]
MARKTKTEKLETLTEQIARLQREHAELEQELFTEVGKYVSKKLDSNDFEEIKNKIDLLVQYDLNHTDNAVVKSEDEPSYTTQPERS